MLREMAVNDIGRDEMGFGVRMEEGDLCITFPVVGICWEKVGA
jgi:hypothetical protein